MPGSTSILKWSLCLILLQIFFLLISLNTSIPLILHTKFQPNISSHSGEIDLNVRVDINFVRVDIHFQTATVTFFVTGIILVSFHIKVQLILHTQFQPYISSHSGENADFIGFAILSIGSHLKF